MAVRKRKENENSMEFYFPIADFGRGSLFVFFCLFFSKIKLDPSGVER